MVKNALKSILISSFIILATACSTSPTYSRKDITNIIPEICKKEFNLDVKSWEIGETIWIYAPFQRLVGSDSKIDPKISENIGKVFHTITRTILSMDKPPKFYIFVSSDINDIGVDLYYIGFIPDIVQFQLEFISLDQIRQRQFIFNTLNPKALGDKEGAHLKKYDISMGEFIAYLSKQAMEEKFIISRYKDNFDVESLRSYYYNNKLGLVFSIRIKQYKENLPYPFEEAKTIIKKFIKIYPDFEDISEIEITDTFAKKTRFYTKKALLEEN